MLKPWIYWEKIKKNCEKSKKLNMVKQTKNVGKAKSMMKNLNSEKTVQQMKRVKKQEKLKLIFSKLFLKSSKNIKQLKKTIERIFEKCDEMS